MAVDSPTACLYCELRQHELRAVKSGAVCNGYPNAVIAEGDDVFHRVVVYVSSRADVFLIVPTLEGSKITNRKKRSGKVSSGGHGQGNPHAMRAEADDVFAGVAIHVS